MKNEEITSFRDLVLQYHKSGQGDIAKCYSREQENKFYNLVALRLSNKYPQFVNYLDSYNLLKDNGQIVTTYMIDKKGFYDSQKNIIGIRHFLNRLTTSIFHEIVHKLGYLAGNGEIKKLPEIYREAGTEYITAETLKSKDTKACIFDNFWGRFPNTISSYFLEYILTKQINAVLGGESLEESILRGNLSFENKMIEFFGKQKYDDITKKITVINREFFCYSAFYNINSPRENQKLRKSMSTSIDNIQDMILKYGFDEKIKLVQNPEMAQNILDEMLRFSELRVRRKEGQHFVDNRFEEYFNSAKQNFSLKFPGITFKQKFIPDEWQTKYSDFKNVMQITAEEEEIVKRMGRENYRKCKGTLLERVFKTKFLKEQYDSDEQYFVTSSDRDFDRELKVAKTILPIASSDEKDTEERQEEIEKPYDMK